MALDFLAGCVGGCAGVAVGHPLDTVKVRLQTQDPRNPVYRGTFHCLRTIVEQESVRGLFKGMSSPMAGVAVINALIFGVYGNVQRRLSDPSSLQSHAIAGAIAGLVQSVVSSPMELVKTRIQLQGQNGNGAILYNGPTDCVRKIWRAEGVRGIFRGLGITVVREIPAFGLYFWSYEVFTRQDNPNVPISTLQMMTAGGLAGMCSWLFTYPIDVLKSRLQADGLSGKPMYSGIKDCIIRSYHNEGYNAFFRGISSTLIRSFPVNATTFTVVTWVFRWMTPKVEDTNVTYQEVASLVQESLAVAFTHDPVSHQYESFVADWKQLGIQLAFTGSIPVRNYAVYFRHDLMGNTNSMGIISTQTHGRQFTDKTSLHSDLCGCGSSEVQTSSETSVCNKCLINGISAGSSAENSNNIKINNNNYIVVNNKDNTDHPAVQS